MMMLFFFSSFFLFFSFDFLFFYFVNLFIFFFCLLGYMGYFDGFFFMDYLSLSIIYMMVWVFVFSYFCLFNSYSSSYLFLFMFFFLLVSFFSVNCLIFYFSFEFVFILMFFYLVGWGLSSERYQASFYMFFFTMVFSLPFFIMILDFIFFYSSCFFLFSMFFYKDYFWFFMFLVFIVKLPLFGFHLWLPKAHVEAPLSGSMILAGVLLKLGGYGIFRFFLLLSFMSFSNSFFFCFLFYLSVFGGLLSSIYCSRQSDLKMLIAYSSVVHMSVMMLGLLSFSGFGSYGSILMMVSHGYVSSLLFYIMAFAYYFFHSRSILLLKGFMLISPIFCLFWFISNVLNLSFPPSMNFFSEILILGSFTFFSFMEWFLLILLCFFTGIYCIYSYVFLSHGLSCFFFSFFLNMKFYFISFSHLFFVVFYLIFCFIY